MSRMSHAERQRRRQMIVRDAKEGVLKELLMQRYGVSETLVKSCCQDAGVVLQRSPVPLEEKCFRFLKHLQNGASAEAAAAHLGINQRMRERMLRAATNAGFLSQD